MASLMERVQFKEVVVDVFGCLVPGALFLAGVFVAVFWPGYLLVSNATTAQFSDFVAAASALASIKSGLGVEVHFLLLILSYVLGYLFFRQDPKMPDVASYNLLSSGTNKHDQTAVCRGPEDCEYPYGNLRTYLESRKLGHLSELVTWTSDDLQGRSKNFINILKTRILFHYPDKYGAVARHEAHIRLMTSSWYAARLLAFASLIGMVLGAVWFLFLGHRLPLFETVMSLVLGIFLSWFCVYGFSRAAAVANFKGFDSWRLFKSDTKALRGEKAQTESQSEKEVSTKEQRAERARSKAQRARLFRFLLAVVTVGFVVLLASLLFPYRGELVWLKPLWISYALLNAGIFAFSTIECFLHYQRVREVIIVLETAFQAFASEHPENLFISGDLSEIRRSAEDFSKKWRGAL